MWKWILLGAAALLELGLVVWIGSRLLRVRVREGAIENADKLKAQNVRLRRVVESLPTCTECGAPSTHDVNGEISPPGGSRCTAHTPSWSASSSVLDLPVRAHPWKEAVDGLQPWDTTEAPAPQTTQPERSLIRDA